MVSTLFSAAPSICSVREVPGAATALASCPSLYTQGCRWCRPCRYRQSSSSYTRAAQQLVDARVRTAAKKPKGFARKTTRVWTAVCALVEHNVESQAQSPDAQDDSPSAKLMTLVSDLRATRDAKERTRKLLQYASQLPLFPDSLRISENRVMGCTAQVWLTAELGEDGRMRFAADSDSEITRGFCSVLIQALNGALPQDVQAVPLETLVGMGLGIFGGTPSRANSWYNVLVTMQKRTTMALAQSEGIDAFELFPSLLVTADKMEAQGSFALAQVRRCRHFDFRDRPKSVWWMTLMADKVLGCPTIFLPATEAFWLVLSLA